MKIPNLAMSSLETCVAAVQIWAAFFLVSLLAQFASPGTWIEQIVILLAGAIAIGTIAYRWTTAINARRDLANVSLLIAAFLIGLDMVAELTD